MPAIKPQKGTILTPNGHWSQRGLVGCWIMNEGKGNIFFDSAGRISGNTNTATWGKGLNGSVLEMNGSQTAYTGEDYSVGIPLTIIARCRPDNITAYGNVLSYGNYGQFAAQFSLQMQYNGRFRAVCFDNATNFYSVNQSLATISAGQWCNVAGVWYSSTQQSLFVDENKYDDTDSIGTMDNAMSLILGSYHGSSANFDGAVSHVFVYSRALSASEIAYLFHNPFCMFDENINPGLLVADNSNIVSLSGQINAQSSAYATLGFAQNISGSINNNSELKGTLSFVQSYPRLERFWQEDVLFNGITANAFKLGTFFSLGWFWYRLEGCVALYRGGNLAEIDFENILAVGNHDDEAFILPNYIIHQDDSSYYYVVRRFNGSGSIEYTIAASVKVTLDSLGDLLEGHPNEVYSVKVNQIQPEKVELMWFYNPLNQVSLPAYFNVYTDNGSGLLDFQNPLAKIPYTGRKYYSCLSPSLEAGEYLFTIRVEDVNQIENKSLVRLKNQIKNNTLQNIQILSAESV